jgi:endoribonuclease Dicer
MCQVHHSREVRVMSSMIISLDNKSVAGSTLRTALLLPSITRRIDDFLLVKEVNAKFFEHSIIEHHLHAAISAPAAGIEFDYERLELLGESF